MKYAAAYKYISERMSLSTLEVWITDDPQQLERVLRNNTARELTLEAEFPFTDSSKNPTTYLERLKNKYGGSIFKTQLPLGAEGIADQTIYTSFETSLIGEMIRRDGFIPVAQGHLRREAV